jgi:hypothetical protein
MVIVEEKTRELAFSNSRAGHLFKRAGVEEVDLEAKVFSYLKCKSISVS